MNTVAIVGAGAIGRATAAYLAHHGHRPALWSPSGEKTAPLVRAAAARGQPDPRRGRLVYEGVLAGTAEIDVLAGAEELAGYDVVVVALPGHAYAAVLPGVVPYLHAGQTVIVSGALSLVPLWLSESAGAPGARPTVAAWGTTLATARITGEARVLINTVRAQFEVAAIPAHAGEAARAACSALFGDRFVLVDNILATALLNVNPVAHAAEVLPNITRIECREDWPLFQYMTPAAARICEAIDGERLAIARGFGIEVRSIEEHYHLSYHVPRGSVAEIAAAIHAKYGGPPGPTTLEHRYLLEDVPYGLVFYEALARVVATPVPNLAAAITLLSTAYGRDFRCDNPLLVEMAFDKMTPAALIERCSGAA